MNDEELQTRKETNMTNQKQNAKRSKKRLLKKSDLTVNSRWGAPVIPPSQWGTLRILQKLWRFGISGTIAIFSIIRMKTWPFWWNYTHLSNHKSCPRAKPQNLCPSNHSVSQIPPWSNPSTRSISHISVKLMSFPKRNIWHWDRNSIFSMLFHNGYTYIL